MNEHFLRDLDRKLADRKSASPDGSYVAQLYNKGLDAILKKVGEEAAETLIAAKNGDAAALVHEVADLWFHTVVLLCSQGLSSADIIAELQRREGVSGLVEKASRGKDET